MKRGAFRLAVALVAYAGSATNAWAQRPSKPPGDDSIGMQWAIAIGLTVVIALSAFINPKRSHLD
jgi:hypothetical protein